MASLAFQNLQGYSIQFSPYNKSLIGCVACQNYGILGAAKLIILNFCGNEISNQSLNIVKEFSWNNALFDLAWSECNENLIVVGGGDGSLILWDISILSDKPLRIFKEHSKEIYSVNWNQTRKNQIILTASWDFNVKTWDVISQSINSSLNSYLHENIVYDAVWSTYDPTIFLSVDGSGFGMIWDTRQTPENPILKLQKQEAEILSCDWCKYDKHLMVTASTDGVIKIWDLRKTNNSLFHLVGHEMAVRRVKFSPLSLSKLVSCSYDYSVRSWDFQKQPSPLETFKNHTEFVYGLDCSLQIPGTIVDCSWDGTVKLFKMISLL